MNFVKAVWCRIPVITNSLGQVGVHQIMRRSGVVIRFTPAHNMLCVFLRRILGYREVGIHVLFLQVVRAGIIDRLLGKASWHVDSVFGLSQC